MKNNGVPRVKTNGPNCHAPTGRHPERVLIPPDLIGEVFSRRDKSKLLQDLMDHIPDVIYFKDRKCRLIMVNKAHAKGLGLKPEKVAGKTDFDIFPKERAEKMYKDDLHVIKTGKPIIDKIERATRADGVDNYVSTTKIPRFDEKGKVIGLIGITRDITKRMQFERLREENERIEKKLKVLEDLNRMKSEFISIVSHELRTPLSIIKESILLIFDGIGGPINETQVQILMKAKNNIERLKKMLDELLDLSRIESAQFKLHYSLVNLNSLLEDPSDFFKKTAQEKGIRLEYILPRREVNIFLDAERINQVISNLITNAIKFTEEGGTIKTELKVLETKARIGVTDTGIGIAKQDLAKLFNKFIQLSKSPEAQGKGVGLGLSIAKDIVEKHGGEIWAESRLGVGSKFYFTIPQFYTTNVLEKDIRNRINNLLDKNISTYLINILIINYKEFKKRVNLKPRKLFKDLRVIIYKTLKGFIRFEGEKPEIAMQDYQRLEYSILFPEATEKEATEICALLKDNMQNYFKDNKAEGIFINLGVLSYSPEGQHKTSQQLLANLHIKKVYIGAEIRRFKRINYKADIEILLPEDRTELSQMVDISLGGICFITQTPLKTDSKMEIKLRLPEKKEPLHIKGRVVWIKHIEEAPRGTVSKYKAGLEFANIKDEDKKILSGFIKSITTG